MYHRRRNFSPSTKREAYSRSGGLCECHLVWQLPTYKIGCGCKLGEGNTFYEHISPDAMNGGNDIDNCAVLSKTCWSLKTKTYDRPTIDKADRQRDRHWGIRPSVFNPLPGGRDDSIRKTMSGKVVDRETGQPWRART